MPAIGFICPDGQKICFDDCFSRCRLQDDLPAGRCKALPFLRRVSWQREWKGQPSVTELLQGTREMWLKITRDYYIDPDSRTYALLGTGIHGILEKLTQGDHLSEERLIGEICSGQFDFYDGEQQVLYDYKTWGSYKLKSINDPVQRALSLLQTSIQLSYYRDLLREHLPSGYDVKKLAVQVINRDGGTWISISRGIQERAPLILLNGISSHWIKKYLTRKKELLLQALERDYAPKCRRTDSWHGRKCNGFCDVKEICEKIP